MKTDYSDLKSLKEARLCGDTHYIGKSCFRNHGGVRFVAQNACVECGRQRQALKSNGITYKDAIAKEKKRRSAEDILEASRLKKELDDY
jgi:hypothetical protein